MKKQRETSAKGIVGLVLFCLVSWTLLVSLAFWLNSEHKRKYITADYRTPAEKNNFVIKVLQ